MREYCSIGRACQLRPNGPDAQERWFTAKFSEQHWIDPQRHERLVREAVDRISEALFRIANSADLTGLSLEVDLQGMQLTHAGEAREQEDKKKAG